MCLLSSVWMEHSTIPDLGRDLANEYYQQKLMQRLLLVQQGSPLCPLHDGGVVVTPKRLQGRRGIVPLHGFIDGSIRRVHC